MDEEGPDDAGSGVTLDERAALLGDIITTLRGVLVANLDSDTLQQLAAHIERRALHTAASARAYADRDTLPARVREVLAAFASQQDPLLPPRRHGAGPVGVAVPATETTTAPRAARTGGAAVSAGAPRLGRPSPAGAGQRADVGAATLPPPAPSADALYSKRLRGALRNASGAAEATLRAQVALAQRLLLLLWHARQCRSTRCTLKACDSMRPLHAHALECDSTSCDRPHCEALRQLCQHHAVCTDVICPICGPVRRAIVACKRAPTPMRAREQLAAALGVSTPPDTTALSGDPADGRVLTGFAALEAEAALAAAAKVRRRAGRALTRRRGAAAAAALDASEARRTARTRQVEAATSLFVSLTVDQIKAHLAALRVDFLPHVPVKVLKTKLESVLTPLTAGQRAQAFAQAVDPVRDSAPDYFSVIRCPMDLGTIRRRLDRGEYRVPEAFADDVRLVFRNAMRYNAPGHDVHRRARQLMAEFEEKWTSVAEQLARASKYAAYPELLPSEERAVSRCSLCRGEKFHHEPPVLFCTKCSQRVKRNNWYHMDPSARLRLCQPCFDTHKGPVQVPGGDRIGKASLHKKKNDETVEEAWVMCDYCHDWMHQSCALFNGRRNDASDARNVPFRCPNCIASLLKRHNHPGPLGTRAWSASSIPATSLSAFIENRVRQRALNEHARMAARLAAQGRDPSHAPQPPVLVVREVAVSDKVAFVKEQFRSRFRGMPGYNDCFPFRSRCLLLFQIEDGVALLLFGLYVQEYGDARPSPNARSVYIAYLDSVKFLHPHQYRTPVYHEVLGAYLAFARDCGYCMCFIWSCPPSKGDDYIMYCHPDEQRTPRPERLRAWYFRMLDACTEEGTVVRRSTLTDEYMSPKRDPDELLTPIRLPYFEGDCWPGLAEDMIAGLPDGDSEAKAPKKKGRVAVGVRSAPPGPGLERYGVVIGEAEAERLRRNRSKRSRKGKKASRPPTRPPAAAQRQWVGRLDPQTVSRRMTPLFHALVKRIEPMKADFIVAHLRHKCSGCDTYILSGHAHIFAIQGPDAHAEDWAAFCDPCREHVESGEFPAELLKGAVHVRSEAVNAPSRIQESGVPIDSEIFDTRQSFLSLCQGNHYQFDELRRVKHSTMMILYHLHNPSAPSFVHSCNHCRRDIAKGTRWTCEECTSFDLCTACHAAKVPHPHPLHAVSAEYAGDSGEASDQDATLMRRQLDQQRIIRQLTDELPHASKCTGTLPDGTACTSHACQRLRTSMAHRATCTLRTKCGECARMMRVLRAHAMRCFEDDCAVLGCADAKQRLREQSDQQSAMDARRRQFAETLNQDDGGDGDDDDDPGEKASSGTPSRPPSPADPEGADAAADQCAVPGPAGKGVRARGKGKGKARGKGRGKGKGR